MHDFMGLAAAITNESQVREMIVIGMMKMPGKHNAENILSTTETLVNRFDFDKSKIIGWFLDFGIEIKPFWLISFN